MLNEGDFFGEMALFERRRHKHDVVAKTKCRIYVLDCRGVVAPVGRSHPEILRRIREVADERADRRAHDGGRRAQGGRTASARAANRPARKRSRPRRGRPSLS